MSTISRRVVLTGIAGLPIAARLIALSRAALADTNLETVSLKTPSGRTVSGVVAAPTTFPAPTLLLIHGGSGLIDLVKSFATNFAHEGFFTAALDLFDGQIATDDAMRTYLQQKVYENPKKAIETISAWIEWLKAEPRSNRRIGLVGWSFGAEWALTASTATPVEATVIYVGVTFQQAEDFAHLKGPVLGHFGEMDSLVRKSAVEQFQARMKEAGKSADVYWYPGDHFFPFPNRPSYDKASADAAWSRTVQFLRTNLQ